MKNKNFEEENLILKNKFYKSDIIEKEYNKSEKTILFIAEYMSLSLKDKITKYLMNNYIRSIKNPITSDTLLHYLCMNDDNFPLIELIKPNSNEIEQKNKLGQTLLHIAIQNRSYKIIEYLLENGSNINVKDNKDNTPLHIAIQLNDYEIIQILLKYNPIANILNIKSETLLGIENKMNNKKLIKYISNIKDSNNRNINVLNKVENNYCKNKKLEIDNNTIVNNFSINNCSLDTKNDSSNNQSFNIYKKKIIANDSKIYEEKTIKNKKTKNLKKSNINNSSFCTKLSYNCINNLSHVGQNNYIYRKTSPKIKNKYTLIEFNDDSENNDFTPKRNCISPKVLSKNNCLYFNKYNNSNKNKNKNSFENYNDYKKCKSNRIENMYKCSPLILNRYGGDNPNDEIKKIRKTLVHKSPFTYCKKQSKKEDLDKQKLYQFLKEIGMQNYGKRLISEGFDDIDLILKQMNEGFPLLEDTLKEIGTIPAGDRAKILIRLQEISNYFNFDFPFDVVYFKNNGSILKWLNREGLSKYHKNFIDAGYQSFELLLIQMASKFKINENILLNELFILNDNDRITILRSLKSNSEKYIKELSKNGKIERTYSKMVKKDSESLCSII